MRASRRPFAIRAQGLRQHHVTVDRHFHLFGRQVQIVFAAFHAQEAVAVAVADHRAAQQIQTFRQRVALAAGKHQLAIALHGAQAAAQRFQLLFTAEAQFVAQFFAAGRRFTFRQMGQDIFTTGDGGFVFFLLLVPGMDLVTLRFLRCHQQDDVEPCLLNVVLFDKQ